MAKPAESYFSPATESVVELRQKKSRFLAVILAVADEEEAQGRIRELEAQYSDATHVCWAWRLGAPARERRFDAGEPVGTAGMPILQVLRGAGLSDVLGVVVRWFGGVKLGKGGLARAYTEVCRQALEGIERVEKLPVRTLRVRVPYDKLGDLRRLVHPPEVEIVHEEWQEAPVITLQVREASWISIAEALAAHGLEVEEPGARRRGRVD